MDTQDECSQYEETQDEGSQFGDTQGQGGQFRHIQNERRQLYDNQEEAEESRFEDTNDERTESEDSEDDDSEVEAITSGANKAAEEFVYLDSGSGAEDNLLINVEDSEEENEKVEGKSKVRKKVKYAKVMKSPQQLRRSLSSMLALPGQQSYEENILSNRLRASRQNRKPVTVTVGGGDSLPRLKEPSSGDGEDVVVPPPPPPLQCSGEPSSSGCTAKAVLSAEGVKKSASVPNRRVRQMTSTLSLPTKTIKHQQKVERSISLKDRKRLRRKTKGILSALEKRDFFRLIYRCELCSRDYATEAGFRVHLSRAHTEYRPLWSKR